MRKRKQCLLIAPFLALLLCAGTAMFAARSPARAASGDDNTPGYHVGANIDLTNVSQVYTDAAYTTTGAMDGTARRYAGSDFIYKAVFAGGAADAWLSVLLHKNGTNVKIQITNDISDGSSWKTVLQSVDDSGTLSMPDGSTALCVRPHADYYNYYIDLSGFMAENGDSPVYAKFTKNKPGSETNVAGLLFFEGNPLNPGGSPTAFVSNRDEMIDASNNPKTDRMFAHCSQFSNSTDTANTPRALVANSNGVYYDGYRYSVWELDVPSCAQGLQIHFRSQGVTAGVQFALFAGGRTVGVKDVVLSGAGNYMCDVTELLSGFWGEEFKLLIKNSQIDTSLGNGLQTGYFYFSFDVPAGKNAPDAGGRSARVADGFNVPEYTGGAGIAAQLNDKVTDNDYVVYFNGKYSGAPYFDNFLYAIFKLEYSGNTMGGYLTLGMSTTSQYSVALCTDDGLAFSKTALNTGGLNYNGEVSYPSFSTYTTIANSAKAFAGLKYVDVSEYLEESGTLYVLVRDPVFTDGSGPHLTGDIKLYLIEAENVSTAVIKYKNNPITFTAGAASYVEAVNWTAADGKTADITVAPDGTYATYDVAYSNGVYTITVTAENATATVYTLTVAVSPKENVSTAVIKYKNNPITFTAGAASYTEAVDWTVADGKTADITVAPDGTCATYAVVYADGIYTITVTAEDATTTVYTLTVAAKPAEKVPVVTPQPEGKGCGAAAASLFGLIGLAGALLFARKNAVK